MIVSNVRPAVVATEAGGTAIIVSSSSDTTSSSSSASYYSAHAGAIWGGVLIAITLVVLVACIACAISNETESDDPRYYPQQAPPRTGARMVRTGAGVASANNKLLKL